MSRHTGTVMSLHIPIGSQPVGGEEMGNKRGGADNTTHLYNLSRLLLPNSMGLACPHC